MKVNSGVNIHWVVDSSLRSLCPSRGCLIGVEVRATTGEPADLPYAVYLERLNGALRERLGYLTRKTHAFAKDIATWDALFRLDLFAHNWICPHLALHRLLAKPIDGRRYKRRSPAIALGLTDRL